MTTTQTRAWPDRAILSWLQQLLLERFGRPFELSQVNNCIHLSSIGREGAIRVVCSADMFGTGGGELPCARWECGAEGWLPALEGALFAPGMATLDVPLIKHSDAGYLIGYDIFGFAYWMLARCEEVDCPETDRYGRFPAHASHAVRHGYLDRPVVDEWFAILRQVIQRQWPGLELSTPVHDMKVSHDVDEPSRYGFKTARGLARTVAVDVLRRREWLAPFRACLVKLSGSRKLSRFDPANRFDWLMDLSERHGLTSAFYFICGRTHAGMDADYEIEHPAIRRLMRRIHLRGHEVGLHPSFETYLSPDRIAREAARLRDVCREEGVSQESWGGRMHYLRWKQPDTLQAWDAAGMSYDSTLGYAEAPGFRCGTCFEYPAFDPVAGRMLSLRIRPLIAMEASVIAPHYLGLSGEAALEKFLSLKRACRDVGGTFTLLWHNSNLRLAEERTLYRQILESAQHVVCVDGPQFK